MVEIPGYKIERELGRGGMAAVYLAVQESVERRVALKIMSPVLLVDSNFSDRFIREAKIAAHLYHPHVVAVHDVGVHDDHHYIAMEYLAGGDLAVRCANAGLDVPTGLRVVREIASALDYAHQKGFVHRDVKPENILFRDDDTAVLTDFGIARAVNSGTQMTKTGAVIGTPQYMSPEQARGRDLDGRSDLYGLGIVLYELLIGRVPYEGSDSVSVGIKHVTEPIPRLPPRLAFIQPVLDRFLAKHPDDRYQSGGEVVADLKRLEAQAITGQTPRVEAPTPEPQSRATRISDEARLPPDRPLPRPDRPALAATPRPDGKLRREPTLGSMDDLSSFDRTASQPVFTPRSPSNPPPRSAPGRRWPLALLMLLIAAVAVGWWQQDRLWEWLYGGEVEALLQRAQTAIEQEDLYGESPEFANRLYQQVLNIEPDNGRARQGLRRLAQHFSDRAEEAAAQGRETQAQIYRDRAAELAPEGDETIAIAAAERPERPAEPAPQSDAHRVARLLEEAAGFEQSGQLVKPEDENALARYRQVLEIDPRHPRAAAGEARVRDLVLQGFDAAVDDGDIQQAEAMLEAVSMVVESNRLEPYQQRLAEAAETARQQQRIEALLDRANVHLRAGRLAGEGSDNAMAAYREVLRLDPDNAAAEQGLTAIAQRWLSSAEAALEADRLEEAKGDLDRIAALRPELPGLERARSRLALYRQQLRPGRLDQADTAQLERKLGQAQEALDAGQLMQPPGSSAYDHFKAALAMNPSSEVARAGIRELSRRLAAQSRQAMARGELSLARARFNDAEQTDPTNAELESLRLSLAAAFRADIPAAIDAGRLEEAGHLFEIASRLQPDHQDLPKLQLQLSIARDSEAES